MPTRHHATNTIPNPKPGSSSGPIVHGPSRGMRKSVWRMPGTRYRELGARLDREGEVIDQPGSSDVRGDQRHQVFTGSRKFLETFRVGDGRVVGPRSGRLEESQHFASNRSHVPFSVPESLGGMLQRSIKGKGGFAFVSAEVPVSATECQAVRIADRGTGPNFDGKVELSTHFTHEKLLLKVLLSEVGALRVDDVEQFQHDGRHAAEVPRTRCTFQDARQRLDVYVSGERRQIK